LDNYSIILGVNAGVIRNIGSITSIIERTYSYVAYAKGIDGIYYGQLLYMCSSPDGHGVPFVLMGDAFEGKLRYKAKTTNGWTSWKVIG
jgi:hypothetical protein